MAFIYSIRPVALGLATWVLASAAIAQEAVVAKNVISDSSISVPGAPALPQFAMLASPKPPKVTCEGSQMTIEADNSTLGEVLSAVHSCIGVKVDIPEGAAGKRIFENLGPGPVREVLESLLSGTELNFVIGASAKDPQKVDAVFLLQRSSETSTTAIADKSLTPARRAWLQSRLNGRPATLGDDNTPTAVDPADIPTVDDTMPDPSKAATSQATPGNSTPSAPDTPVTTPATSTDTASATTTSTASPEVNPDKSTSERIADMQQMFEQRRQITQTQNQGQPPTSNQSQPPTSTQSQAPTSPQP
jgi:hypothetical protein